MSTARVRKDMALALAKVFKEEGRILNDREYSNLGDRAPYRAAAIKKVLGRWPRAVEKARNISGDLLIGLKETDASEQEDSFGILKQMQAALDESKGTSKDAK